MDEEDQIYEVITDSLNIRKGPGVEYEPVASALLRGTRVVLMEQRDRWSKVDVTGSNDIEGWVYNKFLIEIPAAPHVKTKATRTRKGKK